MKINNLYILKDFIIQNKIVSVSDVEKKLNCSLSSAKRYLDILDRENFLVRTHGGAILNEYYFYQNSNKISKSWSDNSNAEKAFLAKKAASFVKSNSSVFLDSSSTSKLIIPHLLKDISIYTNSILIINELLRYDFKKVILIGGEFNKLFFSTVNVEKTIWFFKILLWLLLYFTLINWWTRLCFCSRRIRWLLKNKSNGKFKQCLCNY